MKTMCAKIMMIDFKSLGWIFALLAGFIVTTAYEISELVKIEKKITATFIVQKSCALVVAFSLGYLLKVHIQGNIKNEDVQAGIYAIVGAVGFSLYGIIYRIITNKRAWEQIFFMFIRARIDAATGTNSQSKLDQDGI